MKGTVYHRKLTLVNTDTQRRCYNGCHFSSELVWTNWGVLESNMPESRLTFWRDLAAYAAKERGSRVATEYKWEPSNQGELQ